MVRRQIETRRHVAEPGLKAVLDTLAPRFRKAVHTAAEAYRRLGVPCAIVGGLAVGAHASPRNTEDVDFLVGNEAFHVQGSIISFKAGIPLEAHQTAIDSIPIPEGHQRIFKRALRTAKVSDEGVRVLEPKYLAYMKLLSPRPIDAIDVRSLIDHGLDPKELAKLLTDPKMMARLTRMLETES